jgi:hypothetical protein
MRLSHAHRVVSVRFDDPNLVSWAGLAAVLALVGRCGLGGLVTYRVQIAAKGGANAAAKIVALVAGMVGRPVSVAAIWMFISAYPVLVEYTAVDQGHHGRFISSSGHSTTRPPQPPGRGQDSIQAGRQLLAPRLIFDPMCVWGGQWLRPAHRCAEKGGNEPVLSPTPGHWQGSTLIAVTSAQPPSWPLRGLNRGAARRAADTCCGYAGVGRAG